MNENLEKLTLSNLGDGVAEEQFQFELKKVLENILDINTDYKKPRTITMKITIRPTEDRDSASVFVETKSTVSPISPYATAIFLGREGNQAVCIEHKKPVQLGLFDEQPMTVIMRKEFK